MPTREEIGIALKRAAAAAKTGDPAAAAQARVLARAYQNYQEPETPEIPVAPAETPEERKTRLMGIVEASRGSVDPTQGMNLPEKILAGAGKSVTGMGRGARQLWNYATGDDEELAQLNAEEERARETDAALMGTGGGKVGYYGTEIGSFLLPATKVAKIPAVVRGGRAGLAAAEGGMGALQGALRPTTEGESRATNATVGTLLGAGSAYAAPIASAAYKGFSHIPLLGAGASRRIAATEQRAMQETALAAKQASQARSLANQTANREARTAAQQAKASEKAAAQALKEQQAAVRKRAGAVIEKYVGAGSGDVRVTPAMAKNMRRLSAQYGDELPEFFHNAVKNINVPGTTARVPIQQMHQLKSQLGGKARELTAERKSGLILHEAERAVTDALLSSLPKRKANLLRQAFGEYGTGVATVPRRGVKPLPAPASSASAAPAITAPSRLSKAKARALAIPGNIQRQYLEGMPKAMKRQLIKSGLFPFLESEEDDR